MSESMADKAHREIRRRILRLELAPGAFLIESELQDMLGLGRTPVREAIHRLTREQLLTVIPRRGLMVTEIVPDELPMLYETRALLEPYAARLAATRGHDRHWDEMADVLANAARTDAGADLLELDRRCHELIWDAAANHYLTGTLDMLYAQSERVWHYYLSDVHSMHDAVSEHGEIYDALRAGDADSAGALAEVHVRGFDRQIRKALTKRHA